VSVLGSVRFEGFVRQSNLIEGIDRDPTVDELLAHQTLVYAPEVGFGIGEVSCFVCSLGDVCHAALRSRRGMEVSVGDHEAPPGGPDVVRRLEALLRWMGEPRPTFDQLECDAHEAYGQYEDLHPFLDGNGRSGRALWLRMMLRHDDCNPDVAAYVLSPRILFLNAYHYQTLRKRRA
jgi:Fic/DOC family protein